MNPFGSPYSSFAGMAVEIVDAQHQRRTPRDVRGPWVRTKVPSKARGRKGTRRQFKRKHPPCFIWLYREPTDVLVLHGRTIIATPSQADALRRSALQREGE
jgi:hypothetical protein